MKTLPYTSAINLLSQEKENSWLIDTLWGEESVGILGGEPKCCKSFLSLDIALSISSGTPCLKKYAVKKAGRVLLYAAEDAQHIVKKRLLGIASSRNIDLAICDIQVITSDILRLDHEDDFKALDETVKKLNPRILILDPFVRLHRIDENSSADVALILARLRSIQRQHKTAILLVHHSKKNGSNTRAGQALRGSSEFHAWGDSNLYIRRTADNSLCLSVEHRAAASPPPMQLELKNSLEEDGLSLEIVDFEKKKESFLTPAQRIKEILLSHDNKAHFDTLKKSCGIRIATLCETLKSLSAAGEIKKTETGYELCNQ